MKIKDLIDIINGKYKNFHIPYDMAKCFVFDGIEYPIISVEKRKPFSDEPESACLIYSKEITKEIVDKTLTVKEIIDKLIGLGNEELNILCASFSLDNPTYIHYFECINLIPTDSYGCRNNKTEELFKGYHKEGFLF